MLKRLLILAMVLMVAAPAAAEGPRWEEPAVQLAKEIPLLASNKAYVSMYTGMWWDEYDALFDYFAEQTWQKPLCDVYLYSDMEHLSALMESEGTPMDEETRAAMAEMLPQMISVQLLGPAPGMDAMIVSSALQSSLRYIDPQQQDGQMLFIRFFEDGDPLLYALSAHDGAVILNCSVYVDEQKIRQLQSDSAAVVPYASLNDAVVILTEENEASLGASLSDCRSAQDVSGWMAQQGMRGVLASDAPVTMDVPWPVLEGANRAHKAVALARLTAERLGSVQIQMMTGGEERIMNMLTVWAAGDYSQPRLALHVPLDARTLGPMLWDFPGTVALAADAEDPAVRMAEEMLPGSLGCSLIARASGEAALAASSMGSYAGMYADPEQEDGMGMYLLLYEGGRAMQVAWIARNGVVTLTSGYLALPALAECKTEADVSLLTISMGLPLAFTEVEID